MSRISAFPQGLNESHARARQWYRHANPAAVVGIGLFLAAALAGVFGGQPHPTRIVETTSAKLTLQFPETIRNGEFFEMRATVVAKRPINDLQLAVSSSYWRDLTINTMLPAPSVESSERGNYLFSYGPMKTGDILTIKFDGQINPPLFAGTSGRLKLTDGDRLLASAELDLRVFP